MCCKGLLKKGVAFILTFAVGLLITSIFVTVAAPSFPFKKRGLNKHRHNHYKMKLENRELKLENSRLERRILELERQNDIKQTFEWEGMELEAPPPVLEPVPRAKTR